jgi:hypothetical protein
VTAIPPFLAKKQMTMQIMAVRNKINAVFCYGKVCILSFELHYESAGISITIIII